MYSLSSLYQQYRPLVFRYLHHLSGDPGLAEELTQETFYQAVLSWPRFQGRSSVSTWLLAIARRVHAKERRRQQRFSTPATNIEALPAPAASSPEYAWNRKELQADLQKALQMLPEHYRQVILWREVDEMSFEEIGALLDKTPATVRVLLFRAKRRCREILTASEQGD